MSPATSVSTVDTAPPVDAFAPGHGRGESGLPPEVDPADVPPPVIRRRDGSWLAGVVALSVLLHVAVALAFLIHAAGSPPVPVETAGLHGEEKTVNGDVVSRRSATATPSPDPQSVSVTLVPPENKQPTVKPPQSPQKTSPEKQARAKQAPNPKPKPKPDQPAPVRRKASEKPAASPILSAETPSRTKTAIEPRPKVAKIAEADSKSPVSTPKPDGSPAPQPATPAPETEAAASPPIPAPRPKRRQRPPSVNPTGLSGGDGTASADMSWGMLDATMATKWESADTGRAKSGRGNAAVANYPGEVAKKLGQSLDRVGRRQARGLAGATRVHIVVDAAGKIAGVQVIDDGGSEKLAEAALASVRDAAPFPPIPKASGRQQWTFTVTLDFKKGDAGK